MASFTRLLSLWLLLLAAPLIRAGEISDTLSPLPRTAAGTELGTIKVGPRTYHEVRIKSYDSRSLVFTHSGGLGSARLRDLTPDLQDLLGYDPSQPEPATPARPATAKPTPAPSLSPLPQPVETPATTGIATPSTFDSLVTAFGTTPEIRGLQSLQSEYVRLSFTAKSQGRRPSCAIFAVVSALEFQNAKATGLPQKLSEEYLIWATRRITGQTPSPTAVPPEAPLSPTGAPLLEIPPEDLGYSLSEVVSGLRAYGIAAEFEMPNRYTAGAAKNAVPEESVIASARTRRLVNILPVPGRQNSSVLANIVQALNHGYPVPVSLRWPHERSIRVGFLRDQTPLQNAFHAVSIIGYECKNGRLEDTVFIFKNSYGIEWGINGYGRAAWSYLELNLIDAIVLDVGPGVKIIPDTKS